MATLYRKYRPRNWQEVVNQNHIKITISQEILSGQLAHAYLFSGPRGVGKTTIARVMAASLNCGERPPDSYEPCGKCRHCQQIEAGAYLDIIEIDAASHTGVDNVRDNVIAASRVPAGVGKYKIFIIDEVHMLSTSAFNALLKLLEEPPKNIMFILCTTEIHKIPATIISRCERFDFKRISVSDLVKKLNYIANKENIKIDKAILEAIARQAEGHMRDAESILGQIVAIGGREISREEADLVIPRSSLNEAIELLKLLNAKNAPAAIELVNRLIDEGLDLERFIADFIELSRRLMLMNLNPALNSRFGLELGESVEAELSPIRQGIKPESLFWLIKNFNEARNSLSAYLIPQLPLEMAISEYCRTAMPAVVPGPPPPPAPPRSGSAAAPASPAPAPGNTSGPIGLKEISAKWHEVLARVKKHNHSLSFILRVCQPRDIRGNQVCLAFRYKFHKDRISEAGIRQMVENTFQEVYGQPLTIEAIIDESIGAPEEPGSAPSGASAAADAAGQAKAASKNSDDMINNLLKTFGGKVLK